jgi:predicted ester cyclase
MESADVLFAPSFVFAEPPSSPVTFDRERLKRVLALRRAALPDLELDILEEIEDGDQVATRFRLRVSHRGTLCGLPPTGRQLRFTGINTFRFAAGRIVAQWTKFDELYMVEQIEQIIAAGGQPTPR